MKAYLRLMRVHHYMKNLLVLAALACSGQLFDRAKLLAGAAGFAAFCLVSSAVYIINDIRDRDKDRLHPTKRFRPIASGAVPRNRAVLLAALLLAGAAGCNLAAFRLPSTGLLLLYLAINLAYSFGLKDIPIVDISILVAGFLIRVSYGAIVTGIAVSNWLYLTVTAAAFYFALGKRRNERKRAADDSTRKVLGAYTVEFLDKNMYMCLALTNVFYALWSVDESTKALYNSNWLVFTVPMVLLITMKYSMTIEGESDGDPVEVLLHDKMLLALCVIYLGLMFAILYL